MIAFVSLLFIVWPLLSVPFVLIGYFYNPKYRTFYSILLGLIAGITAYHLTPPETYDLYRHHLLVDDASAYGLAAFLNAVAETSEPIQALITYAISLTHNHDLLQFSVVAIGYSILLYIIGDYAKRNKIKHSTLAIVLLFTLSSLVCINFFSGLWNTFAMLVFALAFYRDMFEQKQRFITYFLYLITPLIHSSMVFPLVILIIFKLSKGQFNFKSLMIVVAIFIAPSVLLPLINYFTDIPFFVQLEPMYNSYFLNGSQFNNLYSGLVIPMELLKVSLYVVVGLLYKTKNNSEVKLRAFILLLSVATLLLVVNSLVFLRFILLVQFIGAMLLMVYFNQRSRLATILIGCTFVLDILFLMYQYLTLKNLDFSSLGLHSLLENIFHLFIK